MPKIKVKPVEQITRKPVSYAYDAFMRHCQLKNLAPYSYLYYNKNIQYFLDTVNEIKYVDEICPEVIEKFIGKLMDAGRKISQNQKTELVIHGMNGRIQSSDSHGNDPCPPKG